MKRDRKIQTLLDADIVGFADWLGEIFGSRARGLAAMIRLLPEFRCWRERHEWCPLCRHFVPFVPSPGAADCDPAARLGRYGDHERKRCEQCPNTGCFARWTGQDDRNEVTRMHLMARLGDPIDVHIKTSGS
ncbi:MAG TPA: hypothetical protein VLM89_13045 [Phycisphaerae bacterium]|nr:hypothetical protein [Phycisphaerae bacterium]